MRLAYPEILGLAENKEAAKFYYDGSVGDLADKLAGLAKRLEKNDLWNGDSGAAVRLAERFEWNNVGAILDEAIETIVKDC